MSSNNLKQFSQTDFQERFARLKYVRRTQEKTSISCKDRV